MICVIQRVKNAAVTIDGKLQSSIQHGLLVFIGVKCGDCAEDARYLAKKIMNLRIFEDALGKMNLSLNDIHGEILIVSQFTLLADCSEGRRPSFAAAARPEEAVPLYEKFISEFKSNGFEPKTGIFGADMAVSLINDGPVTIIAESKK